MKRESTERPWPPPTISAWLRFETVDTLRLREELQHWADWAAGVDDSATGDLYMFLADQADNGRAAS